MIVVLPGFNNVATDPFIVATEVSDEVNDQVPVEVDVGGVTVKVLEVESGTVTLGKDPNVGNGP